MNDKGYELVHFCECDKYAIQSYCAVHNVSEEKNLGDITQVDENSLKDFNVIFGGSPCQDFSISGKQAGSKWKCEDCGTEYNPLVVHHSKRKTCPACGGTNINKTRSSLLVELLRVIKAKKPKWGVYENVKNITGKKFIDTFNMFLEELHEYGYSTYYKVLNAKDYGIPQNRERVYVVFILKGLDNGKFKFPEPFDNGIRLKDMLDDEVDESYYLNNDRADNCIKDILASGKFDKEYSNTARGEQREFRPLSMGFGIDKQMIGIKVSSQCREFHGVAEYSGTLMARDYKGFGNQCMTGVLVKKQNQKT